MAKYEARRFHRHDPRSTIRNGVRSHAFVAPDDATAIEQAKALHAAFYDPAEDQISVWEIHADRDDRLVHLIGGHYA
jgi:alkanesulfonate monooxygenase SsuD/methylene tetrahydromethanopterin reductase-like flavin-dependent oxidoreductase (luciferase family)